MKQVFIAATTAGRSWRAQLIEAEERARAGVPAFVYQLNWPDPAPHMADIPLVFGTYEDPAARPVSSVARLLRKRDIRVVSLAFQETTVPPRA